MLITAVAVYLMNVRLFRTTETALAGLRVRAFRHVHDLSVLHQQGERRGSLVSRVTSDVDQLSVFMQWGGVLGLVSLGQLVVATVVMAVYSWQLTLLVLACFIPLGVAVRWFASAAGRRSTASSASGSATCSARSPSPSSAPPTVRAYGVRARTAARIDAAIDRHYRASVDAQTDRPPRCSSAASSSPPLANAAVVVVGVLLGVGGDIIGRHAGRLPVPGHAVRRAGADRHRGAQRGAERRRRLAPGARRARHRARRRRPGDRRRRRVRELPAGPLGVRFEHVSFRYAPGGRGRRWTTST